MGSGLIYAAIIVMWAAYFIPRWLRRHEELSESRSVEKFDHAMRILSRRDPTPDQRYVVMPRRPEAPDAPRRRRTPVPGPTARPSSRGVGARLPQASRRTRSIAVRRRRGLAVLALLTLALAVATPFTVLPWWAPVALLLVALADLVHLRVQERRRAELTRNREAVRRRTRSRLRRLDSAQRIVEARRVLAEQRSAAEAERVEAEWAAHEAARLEAARPAADPNAWAPTPVPLPTYVTKPKAPRVARPIDLTRPGVWTETRATGREEPFDQTAELGSTQPAPSEPVPDNVPADVPAAREPAVASDAAQDAAYAELDAILEGRRAVNN